MLHSAVARLLKDTRDIDIRAQALESSFPYCPESEDKRKVCPALPLFTQIVDVIPFGLRLERRIANQHSGIMPAQHLFEIGLLRSKSRINTYKFLQENLCQGSRGARRTVCGHATDFFQRDFAHQQNGAHRILGCNSHVWDDD